MRFIIERYYWLQNQLPYGFLLYIQLCCCLLFIVREYGEFNSYILYSCHPLTDSLYRLHNLLGTVVLFVYVALPLRDREVASLHDKLPCEYFSINFCHYGLHIDLLSIL